MRIYPRMLYQQTKQIELRCHTLNDIRMLEQIIHLVELFELSQSDQLIPTNNQMIKYNKNAIHNLLSAILPLKPV